MNLKDVFEDYKYMIIIGVIVIVLILILYGIFKKSRRIKNIMDLPKNYIGLKLKGYAIKVGDGDGFTFFHTPSCFSRKYKKGDELLKIRLAGVDAPEVRKFNVQAQPFANEAKEYLHSLILGKRISLKILGIDLYNRLLATVYVKNIKSRNVNIEMVRMGYACVYEGANAVYDNYRAILIREQAKAQRKKLAM